MGQTLHQDGHLCQTTPCDLESWLRIVPLKGIHFHLGSSLVEYRNEEGGKGRVGERDRGIEGKGEGKESGGEGGGYILNNVTRLNTQIQLQSMITGL